MPKSASIREVNIGIVGMRKTMSDLTNQELLLLSKIIVAKDIAVLLGCSSTNISLRLKRAREEVKEDAPVIIKSEEVVGALRDIVRHDRSLAQGLPKEGNETVGMLLSSCASILDDLVKDEDITKKMYLDVAKVIMQLAKTKVEIFEHYRRVVGVREFRRIVIDEIRKLEPKVADKIATALQNDERLRWML